MAGILLEKNFLIFSKFFLSIIIQKPTPQLKVLNISLSDILLDLSHLKILVTLIFERSIFTFKLSGTDRTIFSISPPPVI